MMQRFSLTEVANISQAFQQHFKWKKKSALTKRAYKDINQNSNCYFINPRS